MAARKFGVDDRVRLIGTDRIQIVRQYNSKTREYQIQSVGDAASIGWFLEIYLELLEPSAA
jgi:hypothetical protein